MEKWQQIEKLINKVLSSISAVISSIFSKIAPSKLLKFIEQSSFAIRTKKLALLQSKNDFAKKVLSTLIILKDKLLVILGKFKNVLSTIISKLKSINFKEQGAKNSLIILMGFLTPFTLKIKKWYLSLKPTTITGFIVISSIGALTGFNVYTQSKKIAEKKAAEAREPAAKVDKATAASKRPAYYKAFEREFRVRNVKFPVHFENKNSMRTLSMDFTVTASNRYIKEFFNSREKLHLVRDKLNTTIRPVIPQFPLEDEGKLIIKHKIQTELNQLINELKIKGKIEKVHIHSILAG